MKFVEIPEKTIKNGMKDAVESGLGIIAGQENGEDFIFHRKEIEYIINCLFSLERRPDFYLNELNPESFSTTREGSSYKNYIDSLKKIFKEEPYLSKVKNLEKATWIINPKKDEPNRVK